MLNCAKIRARYACFILFDPVCVCVRVGSELQDWFFFQDLWLSFRLGVRSPTKYKLLMSIHGPQKPFSWKKDKRALRKLVLQFFYIRGHHCSFARVDSRSLNLGRTSCGWHGIVEGLSMTYIFRNFPKLLARMKYDLRTPTPQVPLPASFCIFVQGSRTEAATKSLGIKRGQRRGWPDAEVLRPSGSAQGL